MFNHYEYVSQKNFPMVLAVAFLVIGMTLSAAHADDDDDDRGSRRGKHAQPLQLNAKWQKECSTCHIAYPPSLLPAESWRKVMDGLDKHFGSDASLTVDENREITDFLVKNASTRMGAATGTLRITETAWFRRKHDSHEVPPAVWKNPQVKSAANCQACHTQAERGDFSERNIRMPR